MCNSCRNSSACSDDELELFSELDQDEQIVLQKRQDAVNNANQQRLQRLTAESPKARSILDNRWVFFQVRKSHFPSPVVVPEVLTADQCQMILDQCLQMEDAWTSDRHSAFPTHDIPLTTTPSFADVVSLLRERVIYKILCPMYGFAPHQLGFRDLFLVKYSACGQRGLAAHTDGCLLSFSILVNGPTDFSGGGTQFFVSDGSPSTLLHPHQGALIHHDSRIKHQGNDITKGERVIIVGFVDTVDTLLKDKLASNQACPNARH
ncbi:hypothetical protein DM01DRAFT_1340703 [Hesseltinella vesiculosa]|uniref:Fe2OG dioxygenase domain-containing protein n=1 Tax=Hesseltinella vesiculosa TaxID=101127 RepID=A0A1X2G3C7_9FUNG|nr:hypothetical protein DM01DRAFT_1340703 [Hesseltinella vesiculosa]